MGVKAFSIGFTGSSLTELLPWIDTQVGDATKVVVSMAGSGKDIAYLARPGRTIYSWDPQPLSAMVVNGVFSAPAELPPPVEFGYQFGYATRTKPFGEGMPIEAGWLADHIAIDGSDYDRVCLAKALIGSTFHGRLKAWLRTASDEDLWERYLKAHANLAQWRGLPGTFVHTQGSVFDDLWLLQKLNGATLLIDTPKVLTGRKAGGDIYSQSFEGLNSTLVQADYQLPPWTQATFERDMPILWSAPWERMIFFHATGCLPDPVEVARDMLADNVPQPTGYHEWPHKGRTDVAWVVDHHRVRVDFPDQQLAAAL